MRLIEILRPECVDLLLSAESKDGALRALAERLARAGTVAIEDALLALTRREAVATTGVGEEVAIPHGTLTAASRSVVGAFCVLPAGVDFDAVDGARVHVVFAVVAPPSMAADHLKALARASRLLRDTKTRTRLRECTTAEQALALIEEHDPV